MNIQPLNSTFHDPDAPLELRAAALGEASDSTSPVVVSVIGSLDIESVSELRRCLKTAFEDLAVTTLILDFAECSYLDSSGLGCLLGGRKLADNHSAILILARLTPRLQRLFDVVALPDFFRIVSTIEDAQTLANSLIPPPTES